MRYDTYGQVTGLRTPSYVLKYRIFFYKKKKKESLMAMRERLVVEQLKVASFNYVFYAAEDLSRE